LGKVFFTADQHFGHEQIMKYENRPFFGEAIMDETMIENWNAVVNPDDLVFVLGDVSFYDKEKTTEIIKRLNGSKNLIKGNHDSENNQWYRDCGFDEVSEFPVIYKDWFVLSHEPPHYYNETMPFFYIFGHVHGTPLYPIVTKQSACVCVERWKYFPVSEAELIQRVKAL
jgi:calcineurin-like phosphoesterase family protein